MTTKVTDVEQNPDRCADIAAALHLLALKFTDLIGTGVPVPFIQLYVQPGRHGDDESVVASVDAVCSALLGHAGQVQEMSDEIYHYSNGEGSEPVGAVSVRIFKPVSAEFAARREAEVAELRAAVPAVPNDGRGDEARTGGHRDETTGLVSGGLVASCSVCGGDHYYHALAEKRDRRTCVDPGDQEHDHETCVDANAEAVATGGEDDAHEAEPVIRYFSFGHGQTDPDTGADLINRYVTVVAPTAQACRDAMFASRYGNRWAFEYIPGTPQADEWIPRWNEHERIDAVPASAE